MVIKTPEVYEYIRLNNISKVQEYIDQFDNEVNKLNLDKLQNLLAYAIDWKKLDIIKILIQNSANPKMINRFAMYYATQNTNDLPSTEIKAYLLFGETLEEYLCRYCNCGDYFVNSKCSCKNV